MILRPDRDKLYLDIAHVYATRGTCPRARVGAVIVRDRRIVSTGYNGAPPGLPHCSDVGCDRGNAVQVAPEAPEEIKQLARYVESPGCKRAVHAELNAIAFAARNTVSTEDAVMYCTHAPCLPCAQAILSAGIIEVHYTKPYRDLAGVELLDEGLVKCFIHSIEVP